MTTFCPPFGPEKGVAGKKGQNMALFLVIFSDQRKGVANPVTLP